MPQLTRRQFMSLGAVGAVGLAGAGWTLSLYNSNFFDDLMVKKYQLTTKAWPSDYPALKIAFLTDLHVGCQSVPLEKLDTIVAQVNALGADIILLGGDYLSNRRSNILWNFVPAEPIAEKLGQLKAPLGVHAILGNYDWSSGRSEILPELEKQNITVLENDVHKIAYGGHDFWLAGLADARKRVPDYAGTLKKIAGDAPIVLLSHNPSTYRDVDSDPRLVVQLSGHTHGGQVRLPFIGPVISSRPEIPLKWMYGRSDDQSCPMIVSSGVGTSSIPVRNIPSEVVLLEVGAA